MDSITVPHEKIDQLRKHFDEAYDSLEDAQWQINKELLEKLKKGGYLFKRPVDDTDYDVKNVKSSEFTESFKVWKKKS